MSIKGLSDEWGCSCDIEIVFPAITMDTLKGFVDEFPISSGCSVDDKSDRGWGCVVTRDQCWEGDRRKISKLIVEFVTPLQSLIQAVINQVDSPAIVRLGIYYSTFTLTVSLDRQALECLSSIGAELEVSTYPSDMN